MTTLPLSDDAERLRYNLTSLSEIGRIFASEINFEKASETALRSILGAVTITSGAVLIYNEQNQTLSNFVHRGLNTPPSDIPINGRLQRLLTQTQKPLILHDPSRLPKTIQAIKKYIRPFSPHIWVPLVMQQELQGVLSLGGKFLNESYRPEELHLLDTIAHHFAVGLYNQRLIADTRNANFQLNHKIVELETLYEAGLALSSSLKVDNVVEEVLLLSVGVIDARTGALFVRDEKSGTLTLIHQVGLTDNQIAQLNTPAMRRRFNQVLNTQKVRTLKQDTTPKALNITYSLIAPVGQVGILAVFDKEDRQGVIPFTESDTRLLELMGQQAGSALANARLYDNILEVKNYNQNILTSIGNGVITTDLNGKIAQINAAIERVFGNQTIKLGQSCAHFFQQAGCHTLAKEIRASLKDGQSRQVNGEQALTYGITLDAQIAALRNEQEEIQGLVIALEDLTEKELIRDRFKQYASDQVVDLLLDQKAPPTLGGEEREVTMLFADIRGSSDFLRRVGAQKMVAVLNRCFSRLNEIIFQYNGTLDKYTGDGFLVVYGAPVAFSDDSERAIRTALSMQEEMLKLNRETGETLGMGLGLARGKVIAGNIGSLRRMEYTVIGESVNVAARLCDGARTGQIWAGANIYQTLKDKFEFQHLGRKRFKGFDPLDVYEVIGVKGARRGRAQQLGGAMPKRKNMQKIIDLTIPMLPEMELAATKTAEGVAQFMGLSEDKLEEVKMALIEACINAFEHSQSKDEQITINFAIGDDDLTIQISDTGQGFDPDLARKEVVARRERGESKRGWGLTIMSELMDNVAIQSDENGTVITMIKKR